MGTADNKKLVSRFIRTKEKQNRNVKFCEIPYLHILSFSNVIWENLMDIKARKYWQAEYDMCSIQGNQGTQIIFADTCLHTPLNI